MRQHDILFNNYLEELRLSVHIVKQDIEYWKQHRLIYPELESSIEEKSILEKLSEERAIENLVREYWHSCHNLNVKNHNKGIQEFENPHKFIHERLKEVDRELFDLVTIIKANTKLEF